MQTLEKKIDVFVDKDFRLMVMSSSYGLAAGPVIQIVNGIDAVKITRHIEQRIFGDNTDVRRVLVADRFTENLWIHYGSSPSFELEINGTVGKVQLCFPNTALEPVKNKLQGIVLV